MFSAPLIHYLSLCGEQKESQGDERMPLKFAVKERDAPALPKPLEGQFCGPLQCYS